MHGTNTSVREGPDLSPPGRSSWTFCAPPRTRQSTGNDRSRFRLSGSTPSYQPFDRGSYYETLIGQFFILPLLLGSWGEVKKVLRHPSFPRRYWIGAGEERREK